MELTVHYNSTDLNQTMIVSIPPNAEVDQSSHVSYTCFMILFINFLYVFNYSSWKDDKITISITDIW